MTITIDGLSIKKKEDFYANIKTELNVPEYFGNNLDALYDILTEHPDRLQKMCIRDSGGTCPVFWLRTIDNALSIAMIHALLFGALAT